MVSGGLWLNCHLYSTIGQGGLLNKIKSEKIYLDTAKDKLDILKENRGRSGVYLWENRNNGKIYVGSSVNLARRIITYFNLNYLINEPRYFNNALLKHGYSSFSLYVLEYCSKEDLIMREQHYIDLLKPNYNVSLSASGVNFGETNHFYGKVHTLEAREKMSTKKLLSIMSEETKKKISATMSGKVFSEEHKTSLSLAKKNSKKLSVLNIQTNEETMFDSISKAEKSLGFPKDSIRLNIKSKSGNPYRGIYKFKLL